MKKFFINYSTQALIICLAILFFTLTSAKAEPNSGIILNIDLGAGQAVGDLEDTAPGTTAATKSIKPDAEKTAFVPKIGIGYQGQINNSYSLGLVLFYSREEYSYYVEVDTRFYDGTVEQVYKPELVSDNIGISLQNVFHLTPKFDITLALEAGISNITRSYTYTETFDPYFGPDLLLLSENGSTNQAGTTFGGFNMSFNYAVTPNFTLGLSYGGKVTGKFEVRDKVTDAKYEYSSVFGGGVGLNIKFLIPNRSQSINSNAPVDASAPLSTTPPANQTPAQIPG